jgi:hypothetical protein
VGKLLPNLDCVKTTCEYDAGFLFASAPQTETVLAGRVRAEYSWNAARRELRYGRRGDLARRGVLCYWIAGGTSLIFQLRGLMFCAFVRERKLTFRINLMFFQFCD